MFKVRNPEKVLSCLKTLPDKSLVTSKKLTIEFPTRFTEIGLGEVSSNSFAFGLFAMSLETGEYALINVNTLIELGKASLSKRTVNGVEYLNFTYEPGDRVFKTIETIARPSLIFTAIEEFVFKGKVPWYVEYEDMGRLFDTAKKYSKSKADIIPPVAEFIAAYIGRDRKDTSKYIRETAKNEKDFRNIKWVPMRSVYYSSPGTVNKLAGAYFNDGIVSALVNPSERVDHVEKILRS